LDRCSVLCVIVRQRVQLTEGTMSHATVAQFKVSEGKSTQMILTRLRNVLNLLSGLNDLNVQYCMQVQVPRPQLSTPPMIMSRASSVNAARAGVEGAPG
jgi:hypothetical protein